MTDPNPPQANTAGGATRDDRGSDRAGRYLTIEELAATTKLSVSTLRRLRKQGRIVGHQPGGPRHRVVFPPDAIEQVADARKSASAEAAPQVPPAGGTTRPQRGPQPKWSRGA